MAASFDEGFRRPYDRLVREAPGDDVYPQAAFRTEWGPIFHRGRLDGSARVLVLGQDPATHETICRRILVGEAGQRLQGFLAKLGITRSYVLINALLYSVYGQGGGTKHVSDDGIVAYRNRWLDTLVERNELDAIVSLGQLADVSYQRWRDDTAVAGADAVAYRNVIHPTYPESASATGTITKAAAMARLTTSWNDALTALHGSVASRRGGRPRALRGGDRQDRPGADPADRPPRRAAAVDVRARRVGVSHRRRCADQAGDHHGHGAPLEPDVAGAPAKPAKKKAAAAKVASRRR